MKIVLFILVGLFWIFLFDIINQSFIKHSDFIIYGGETEAFLGSILQSVGYVLGFIPLLLILKNNKKNSHNTISPQNTKLKEKQKIKKEFKKISYDLYKNIPQKVMLFKKERGKNNYFAVSLNDVLDDYQTEECEGINYYINKSDFMNSSTKTLININEYFQVFKTDDQYFLGHLKTDFKNQTIYYLPDKIPYEEISNQIVEDLNDKITDETIKEFEEQNPKNDNLIESKGLDIKEAKILLSKHYKIPVKDIEIHLKG